MNNCLLGDLAPNLRWIVEEIHRRRFGRVENLVIRKGEPQRDPAPVIVTTWKFGSRDNAAPAETRLGNFVLKEQFLDMFRLFETLGDGVIDTLEFHNGLPFKSDIVDHFAKK